MIPEIALGSVVIIVIVLFPGLVFRRLYYWGSFSKQFVKGEWAERIVTSIFWGIISQILSIIIFSYIPWVQNFLPESFFINESEITNFNLKYLINNKKYFTLILSYILFSIIISGLIGYTLHKIIRILRLDIVFPVFRYSNHWHYLFKGELSKFNISIPKAKVDFAWVDLTIKSEENEKTKLIQGVLCDYSIDATTGNLEYLYLQEARRYSNTINNFKNIPSDIFTVPFSNILDMNIRYKYKTSDPRKWEKQCDLIINILIIPIIIGFFIIPWFFAKSHIGIGRLIISYILAFFLVISILGILFSIKEKKWKIFSLYMFIGIVFFLFTILGLGYF